MGSPADQRQLLLPVDADYSCRSWGETIWYRRYRIGHRSAGSANAQYFARRNSQLAWTLRLRATRTKRLMEEIDRVGAGMYKGRPKDSSEPLGSPAERGRGSTDPDAPNNRQGDTR